MHSIGRLTATSRERRLRRVRIPRGEDGMSRRLAWLAAAVGFASVASAIPPGLAGTSSSDRAILEQCRERFVVVAGEEDPTLPQGYEPVRDASGGPLLFVSTLRCERYTVNGITRPTTIALFTAIIESPDGGGCASRWPLVGDVKGDALPYCNSHVLFAAYDNPAVVDWLRAGTPDLPVHYVEGLVYEQEDLDPASLGAPFHFEAPPPTPSPFEMDAIVRERPVEGPITQTFWATSAAGTVRLRFESDDLAFGEADGTLRAAPGSEMARMFGTETPAPSPGFSAFAGIHWRYGELSKEVLP